MDREKEREGAKKKGTKRDRDREKEREREKAWGCLGTVGQGQRPDVHPQQDALDPSTPLYPNLREVVTMEFSPRTNARSTIGQHVTGYVGSDTNVNWKQRIFLCKMGWMTRLTISLETGSIYWNSEIETELSQGWDEKQFYESIVLYIYIYIYGSLVSEVKCILMFERITWVINM